MPENPHVCPKCGASMSLGFLTTWREGNANASRWIEGEAATDWQSAAKWGDRPQWIVSTYRCVGCGFLEAYANEQG